MPRPVPRRVPLWFLWRDYAPVVCLTALPCIVILAVLLSTTGGRRADLVFCNGDEPQTLDPALVTSVSGGRLVYALFEGLTVYDPRVRAVTPAAAERWEASPDGRIYTFRLRQSRWSDGAPLTASDFVYSWRRAVTPSTAAPYATVFECIEGAREITSGLLTPQSLGVEALDDRTLRVRLRAPTAYFPELVALTPFLPVPRSCIERHGRLWTRPANMVCNGPFVLSDWEINRRLVLRRNPRFRAGREVRLDRVDALTVPDPGAQMNFYLTGASDVMVSVPNALVGPLSRRADFHASPAFETHFLRINVSRPGHPLSDPRVRRALCMAVDRERICRYVVRGGETPATTLVPPGIPGYVSPRGLSLDVAAANRLLDEAGFKDRSRFPVLTLVFNTNPVHRDVAEVLQSMWRDHLGIRVELKNMEFKTFMQRVLQLDYDVARGSWSGDYCEPSTFLDCFRAASGNNRTGWRDAEYDRLLDEASQAADTPSRFALYARAEQRLVADAVPILPLYYGVNLRMWKPWVHGMTADPMGLVMLRFMSVQR